MKTRLIRTELLQLHGPDAGAFIHAQFMADSRTLTDGEWQWSGWLTPKGRLVAFFALVRVAADDFMVWLPDGGADTLRERLQRFVFRSKVMLTTRRDLHAIGRFGTPKLQDIGSDDSPANTIARFTLTAPGHDDERALDIVDDPDGIPTDQGLIARWQLADLARSIPYIAAGGDNSEQFVPQWLSLDRLDAYSVKKGCYPGQEIVARMHFLGQSKRAAFRLAGDGDPPPAMTAVLDAAGKSLGEIVWSTSDADGWQALAALASEYAPGAHHLGLDERACRLLPPG